MPPDSIKGVSRMVLSFVGPPLSLPGGGGKTGECHFSYWVGTVLIFTTNLALELMLTCDDACSACGRPYLWFCVVGYCSLF